MTSADGNPPKDGTRLPVTTQRWPDEDGPWLLTMHWQIIDGVPECVAATLTSTRLPGDRKTTAEMPQVGAALTAGVIRQARLADQIRQQRAELAAEHTPPVAPGSGMRSSAVERLREAAEVYRAAFAAGGKPTVAVAEHFGITPGGASSLVARAREAGFLPPTSAGAAQA